MRLRGISRKTPEQFAAMRRAGLVVAHTLEELREAVTAGLSTKGLNEIAERRIRASGATPSFLGYHGYPASICVSVNEQVVHGIPGPRVLQEGDLVSLDCGAIVEGWHGDAAITVAVGEVSPQLQALMHTCEEALWAGIAAVRPGGRLGDIGAAVDARVKAGGPYGNVDDYGGHGIGRQMHEEPGVPNAGVAGRGPKLHVGIALAIEPMITLGTPETDLLADEWTVVSSDGTWAAHYEHTVALTEDGPRVFTALDEGRSRLPG